MFYLLILIALVTTTLFAEEKTDAAAPVAEIVIADAARDLKDTLITPHLHQKHVSGKNLLWCATSQLAWNELCAFVREPVKLEGDPEAAKHLNKREFTAESLDDKSYVALFGLGADGLWKIKDELAKKFSNAGARLLPDTLSEQEFIAYSFLFKNLKFKTPFAKTADSLRFAGQPVQSFGVWMDNTPKAWSKRAAQVTVRHYVGPNDFVIELETENGDRCVIAHGEAGKTLGDSVKAALSHKSAQAPLHDDERVEIPLCNFDVTTAFPELHNRHFLNKTLPEGSILIDSLQRIQFRLDESGALLKSEARHHGSLGEAGPDDGPRRQPRRFVCDGPFLLLLIEKDARLPYFAYWVATPELLLSGKAPPSPIRRKGSVGEANPD